MDPSSSSRRARSLCGAEVIFGSRAGFGRFRDGFPHSTPFASALDNRDFSSLNRCD
jgi:hypothetical protein